MANPVSTSFGIKPNAPGSSMASRVIITVFLLHSITVLGFAAAIALPRPWSPSMGPDLFVGFSGYFNTLFSTFVVLVHVMPQIRTLWQSGSPNSLSIWTLGLQTIVFILLGISWLLRLGTPDLPDKPPGVPIGLKYWYYLVGWPSLNYILAGCGQGVLFALCLYLKWKKSGMALSYDTSSQAANEQTPLIEEQ